MQNTSKTEFKALNALKTNDLEVFGTKDLKLLAGLSMSQTYNLVKSLKKKGHIEAIRNGLYCISGTDEMIIASRIVHPSYISFLSALNYYGLTDQVPVKITLATTKGKKHKHYIFATLNKTKFFGYTHIGNIIIAEKEKALIDSLTLPRYSGGITEILKCFRNAKNNINKKKLYSYAIRMNSKILLRRLGFIMESLRLRFEFNLVSKIGTGFELLDPSMNRKNNYNKKWLLDVNI